MKFRTVEVAGEKAVADVLRRRDAFDETGFYPFIIGDADDLARIREAGGHHRGSFESIVEASRSIDLEPWIQQRREDTEAIAEAPLDPGLEGAWPGEIAEKGQVCGHRDLGSGGLMSKVIVGLAPVEAAWQLPAAVPWGGWNECPEPEVHCAFLRSWETRYGARVIGMTGDVLECTVAEPPRDRDEAMALAWEHYWYCGDIVDQGVETVAALAATILNSDYWFFWWD